MNDQTVPPDIQKRVAEALGMKIDEYGLPIPDDSWSGEEDLKPPKIVKKKAPKAIVKVENPDLPDFSDIEQSLKEGEEQLEDFIDRTSTSLDRCIREISISPPSMRSRAIQATSEMMGKVFDAIKYKNDLQLKKKELRLKEVGFIKSKPAPTPITGGSGNTINIYSGSREDVIKELKATVLAHTEEQDEA